MSTTFETTKETRTFEAVSARAYGSAKYASLIESANGSFKGITPLPIGVTLVIPDRQKSQGGNSSGTQKPFVADSLPSPKDDGTNKVTILIDGKEFEFWESVSFTRSLDAIDGITFQAPFNPDDQAFRETFRPFSFKDVELKIGGGRFFKGTLVNVTPIFEPERRYITVSCYSKPGVLQDCTLPQGSYPKNEIEKQKLTQITATCLEPFGLGYSFLDDPGPIFEPRVAIPEGATVHEFLMSLAKQRGFVMSSTTEGDLLFWKGKGEGSSVANFKEGQPPLDSVSASFYPQSYYSEITAISPTTTGKVGEPTPAKNKHYKGFRPFVFVAPDAKGVESKQPAEAALGRMFGNAVSYSVEVSTWRDKSGKLWEPNTIIDMIYPSAMIYNETQLLIRSVTFEQTPTRENASLDLVLTSSFSEKTPEILPWE